MKIIISISIITLAISLTIIIKDYKQYKKSKEDIKELVNEVIIEKENEKIKIDWDMLEATNSDIIGWIKINDTNIDYPILKDDDSLKYMKQGFDKSYNSNGSIFTINNNPFETEETVLYRT